MPPTLKRPPHRRVLRTALQVLVAIAALVPLIVQVAGVFGADINGPALVAVAGVAVMVATSVVNTIEQAGPVPIVRTLAQVLAGLVVLVPAVVAGLAQGGIHLDGAALAVLAGAAVMAITILQNLLEQLGIIPELGATRQSDHGRPS